MCVCVCAFACAHAREHCTLPLRSTKLGKFVLVESRGRRDAEPLLPDYHCVVCCVRCVWYKAAAVYSLLRQGGRAERFVHNSALGVRNQTVVFEAIGHGNADRKIRVLRKQFRTWCSHDRIRTSGSADLTTWGRVA